MEREDEPRETVSAVLIDHAQRPRNNYPLTEFDGRARYTGNCGDTIEVWVQVRDGIVEQATFTTDGCAISHACGSMTTCMAEGRPLEEMEELEPEHVIRAFSGLPAGHEHCAELSASALKLACANVGEPGGGAEVAPDGVAGVVVRVATPVAAGRVVGLVEDADRFALVDVDAGSMSVLNREDAEAPQRAAGPEDPVVPEEPARLPAWLREHGVHVLLCGSMADDARARFADLGVQVVVDAAPDIPEELIAEYLAHSLFAGGNGRG